MLREQRDPEKGIPELTDEVVYRAAVSNAPDIYPFAFAPFLEMIPGGSTRFSKERITQTAKLLFGWECEINFENLGDTGRYPFHPYFGVATLEGGLVKTGATPVVTAYEAGRGSTRPTSYSCTGTRWGRRTMSITMGKNLSR